ncbi:hypothetical protein AOQ88_02485 [Candidatus Riesia sp. GBBU]|nr:hypothetical protein AOQ88_01965 [Candidatus Riesia sp. GBBU]ARC55083.1 hypothetical protein AOQ88_02485 [Candidatus Riesia sp. GBBU]
MPYLRKFFYDFLSKITKYFIRIYIIPKNPMKKFGINRKNIILYLFESFSKRNLVILRNKCVSLGLFDPLNKINLNRIEINSYFSFKNKEDILKIILDKNIDKIIKKLDIKILPVSVIMFSGNKKKGMFFIHNLIRKIKVFFSLLVGSDFFIFFLKPVSLNDILKKNKYDDLFIEKLIRLTRISFIRNKISILGPDVNIQKNIKNKVLSSKKVQNLIYKKSRTENISVKKSKKTIIKLINEISSKFSYNMVVITGKILSKVFKIIYKNINVKYIERVHKVIKNGNKIVYISSHKSHMDYLLLSYILYKNGIFPPYIAAGINLNFWPIGTILKKLGAFFIRRSTFNKTYSIILKEYLKCLLHIGCSIEYFIEGERSRTGVLLNPKTGILSTIVEYAKNKLNSIVIIPVNITYECIFEISSYSREIKENRKRKENFYSLVKNLIKLKNLGESYINFGKPIYLSKFLNKNIFCLDSNACENIDLFKINIITKKLSETIMKEIDKSLNINIVQLCSIVIFFSKNNFVEINKFIKQIKIYISLVAKRYKKFFSNIEKIKRLIIESSKLKVFSLKKKFTKVFVYSDKNNYSIFYYKNNIEHLFILQSLVVLILIKKFLTKKEIYNIVILIYPFMKITYFLRYSSNKLVYEINETLKNLENQKIIFFINKKIIKINKNFIEFLESFSEISKNVLFLYLFLFNCLVNSSKFDRNNLKQTIQVKTKKFFQKNKKFSHFFSKTFFTKFLSTLKNEGYTDEPGKEIFMKKTKSFYKTLKEFF